MYIKDQQLVQKLQDQFTSGQISSDQMIKTLKDLSSQDNK